MKYFLRLNITDLSIQQLHINRSPREGSVWQRYKTGEANIYDIHDVETGYANYHSADRDVRFWLQYLPQISNLNSAKKSEQLIGNKGQSKIHIH